MEEPSTEHNIYPVKIGEIKSEVIHALSLSVSEGTPIYLGSSNIEHTINKHPFDYNKYGKYIGLIVNEPDFVGLNAKNQSIEYVKEFLIDEDFVKVAVRASSIGKYFVRSLYTLNTERAIRFISKGTLNP